MLIAFPTNLMLHTHILVIAIPKRRDRNDTFVLKSYALGIKEILLFPVVK